MSKAVVELVVRLQFVKVTLGEFATLDGADFDRGGQLVYAMLDGRLIE